MKHIPIGLTVLALAGQVAANEALDILENNERINELELPPVGDGEETVDQTPAVFVPVAYPERPEMNAVWDRLPVYENQNNRWVQEVSMMGGYEWGGSWGDARVKGGSDTDLDTTRTRRARLGARMKIFGNTEIEVVGEFAGDADYQRIERIKAKTRIDTSRLAAGSSFLEYGKFQPGFGIEQSKDSSELLTPERSLLANMLMPASTMGVRFSHESGPWSWGIGWFSADSDRYLPGIEGAGFLAANLAYEETSRLDSGSVVRTRWHFDYLHNLDGEDSESVPRYDLAGNLSANGGQAIVMNPAYKHMLSTGISMESEEFALETDFQLANGDESAWGLTITPSYWVMPGVVRVVGRYHYADSNGAGGLFGGMGAGSDSYYDSSPTFIGDEFHSFYAGANVHFHEDKLVLLNGLEWATMKDEAGGGYETSAWIWHTGARLSF